MANVSSSNGLEKRPKLRFPGFDEPWCSHKFSSVFSFLQNNTLSRAELDATGDVLDIHYGDVLIKYGSILNATDNTIPHIISGHESTNYDYLQDGDIIVADTAEDETVGKTIELLNISGRKIEAGLHTVPCRPLFPFASMYLGYYMNTPHYHKQLVPLMQGIKVLSISKGNISKTEISSPQTIAEQEKISRFLYLLDQRAAAQSKIIDALKKYKRGLLSNLFGEKITQGCTTKSYYFSEIAQRRSEKYDPSSGIEYPCVELENIEQETGKILATVPSTAQSSIKNIAMPGDTLFGKLRPYLRKYAFAKKTMACSSEIWALIPSDVVLPKFLFYLVQTEHFLRVANISSGTKMPRAEWSNIEKAEFFIPDFSVQRKVVSLLEGLDQKITFADSTLLSLNRLKASLLQHLFI